MLLSLKQTGPVEEYREKFELYVGPLKFADTTYLKGIFLNGLKEVIRAELKLHPEETLAELMDFAQGVDDKNNLVTIGRNSTCSGGKQMRTYNNTRMVTWELGVKQQTQTSMLAVGSSTEEGIVAKPTGTFRSRDFRKLTEAEMQERSRKGLCFRCDEKFSPGHVSANKQLHVLVLAVEDEKCELEKEPKSLEMEEELKNFQLSM